MNGVYRFFGGSPFHVMIRLVLMSVLVGVILAALNIRPIQVLWWLEDMVIRIYSMGFEAIRLGGEYFLLGAVIVFPIWLIMRLMAMGKRTPRE